jgi:conjugal transfer pilus assembly protein TraU
MKHFSWLAGILLILLSWSPTQATAASNAGDGRWVNPITDVCWKCLFPMTLGNIQLASGPQKDTANPSSPIQICPVGVLYRVGLAIGFWEPMAMVDVTREPGVMVNMGDLKSTWGGRAQGRQVRVTGPQPARFTTFTGTNTR